MPLPPAAKACHRALVPATVDVCLIHGLACIGVESIAADRERLLDAIAALSVPHIHEPAAFCLDPCPRALLRRVIATVESIALPLPITPLRGRSCPKCGATQSAICATCTSPL